MPFGRRCIAAWMHDAGQDNEGDVGRRPGLQVVNQVMYDCVQFHGGMGYSASRRSNACTATPASCRSAVAPPKSCSKRSPSAPTAEGCHRREPRTMILHTLELALPHRSHHRTGWCLLPTCRRSRRRRVRGCRTAEQDRPDAPPRRNSASTRAARTGVYAEATIARSTRYRILAVARSLRSDAALSHSRETAATTRLHDSATIIKPNRRTRTQRQPTRTGQPRDSRDRPCSSGRRFVVVPKRERGGDGP